MGRAGKHRSAGSQAATSADAVSSLRDTKKTKCTTHPRTETQARLYIHTGLTAKGRQISFHSLLLFTAGCCLRRIQSYAARS